MMLHELSIEVEPRCISVWKKPWAKRFARVTLLVDFNGEFVIVMDSSNGFWFLPGGGLELNESIEEAAKREAAEELDLEIEVDRIIKMFYVTLVSKEITEQLRIHPFIVVRAIYSGGQLKTEYARKRKILLVKKDERDTLLQYFQVPKEYECMKPYLFVSKETVREFFKH